MLSLQKKRNLYHELEMYRLWHCWSQNRFVSDMISYATYAKMKEANNRIQDQSYVDLLSYYGFDIEHDLVYHEIKEQIVSLHDALSRCELESSSALLEQLEHHLSIQNTCIESINLRLFLHRLLQYVKNDVYLSESQIEALLSYYQNKPKPLKDLILYYMIYSATKISFTYQQYLYEKIEALRVSDYLPIMVHYMGYLINCKQFQKALLLGNEIYQKAHETKNHYMLFEYYENMLAYYIRYEPNQVEKTQKQIEAIMKQIHFPRIKKMQYYRNYAKRCISKHEYQKALAAFQEIQEYSLQGNVHDRVSIIYNITFCESQLQIPYSIAYDYALKKEHFESKADYYLFQYFLKKNDMTNAQRVRYLHKIAKVMKDHEDYTKFQIREELYMISMKDKKADLFRYLENR